MNSDDFTLELVNEEEVHLTCKVHPFVRASSFIDVEIKSTGKVVKKCMHCHYAKLEKIKIRRKEWEEHKNRITDYYVKRMLAFNGGKNTGDYPQELIEAKKASLQLKKLIKEKEAPLHTCKKHGKLYENDVIKKGESYGKQRYRCKICYKDVRDKYYQLNKLKVNLKNKKYKVENPEKIREWRLNARKSSDFRNKEGLRQARYRENKRELLRQREAERHRKEYDNLTDRYVKKTLFGCYKTKNNGFDLNGIPTELVEMQRAILLLKRQIKLKNTEKSK